MKTDKVVFTEDLKEKYKEQLLDLGEYLYAVEKEDCTEEWFKHRICELFEGVYKKGKSIRPKPRRRTVYGKIMG